MALILTRSPYYISRANLDDGAVLTLDIGNIDVFDFNIFKTYTLNFRSKLFVDISPLIRDWFEATYTYNTSQYDVDKGQKNIVYVRTTLAGNISGVSQTSIEGEYFATDGYLYGTDDYNEDKSDFLRKNAYYTGSSDTIYKLDDSNIRLTFLKTDDDLIPVFPIPTNPVYIKYYNKGVVVQENQFFPDDDDSETYYETVSNLDYDSYKARVSSDSGTFEISKCLNSFFREFSLDEVDEILLSSQPYGFTDNIVKKIKVNTISECKYTPYRITFKNRFGADEDLWFFKKSSKSLKVSKEDFRSNEFKAYNAGETTRQMQQYNKNGRELLTLNSGFVVEELNKSFKQLMLSEEVTLYDFKNDITSAVNITNGELEYKTVTNDKLINYTIDVEFANDVINNIV